MADENVEGTLSVDFDGSRIEQAIKKAAAEVEKAARDMVKSTDKVEDGLEGLADSVTKDFTGVRRTVQQVNADIDKLVAGKKRLRPEEGEQLRRLRTERREINDAERSSQVAQRKQERELRVQSNREFEKSEKDRRRLIRETTWAENAEKRRAAKELSKQQTEDERRAARERKQALADEKRERRQADLTLRREQKESEAQVRRERRQNLQDEHRIQRVMTRAMSAPENVQAQINSILRGQGAQVARLGMMNVGLSPAQAIMTQLRSGGIAPGAATYLAGGGGRRPPGFTPPGGGGAAGGGNWFQRNLGRIGSGIASGLGIGVAGMGGYAAIQGARAVIEATETATAYERQRVAAENLAGSQDKLNALLDAYSEASGGAVDKVTELSNVTRLLATGFADSVPDVERFVRATRGASIALGKPQDYVIQETQLAISNTSQKRLDQIGLSVEEVTDKIEKLRATNAEWSRENAFQEAVLTLMDEKYGNLTDTVEGQATGVERLRTAWKNLNLAMGQSASGPVNQVSGFFADILSSGEQRRNAFAGAAESGDFTPDINATEAEKQGIRAAQMDTQLKSDFAKLDQAINNFYRWTIGLPDISQSPLFLDKPADWLVSAAGSAMPPASLGPLGQYNEQQQDAIRDGFAQEEALRKSYGDARLAEIKSYEEQRASIIQSYGKNMVREEEDFARQRARGLRDYERSIMDVLRDGRERDAEMAEDLDETIADAREDHSKRLVELEEDYNKQREKAEKEHRDRLMKAAGQLDAIAVLEERKRWRDEKKEREEGHREAIEDARESLQEQIDEAREAYQERLDDARKADEKRLEDMRVNRERQLIDEDEDRALRLARAKEDHDDQLAELDRVHGLRMAQITQEYEDQKTALEGQLKAQFHAVGIYVAGYLAEIEKRDKAIEQWFDNVILEMERRIAGKKASTYSYDPTTGPNIPLDYGTGLAGDYGVYNRNSSSNVSNTRTVMVQEGAISVFTTPGMEEMVGELVLEKVTEYLEGYE